MNSVSFAEIGVHWPVILNLLAGSLAGLGLDGATGRTI